VFKIPFAILMTMVYMVRCVLKYVAIVLGDGRKFGRILIYSLSPHKL
jgi:hypothetical protein